MSESACPPLATLKYLFEYRNGVLIRRVTVNGRAKAGEEAGSLSTEGYKRVRINGRHYQAHRLIYAMHHEGIGHGEIVDHINGDRSDNRIENLRLVTAQQNNFNMRNVKGYTKVKGKYRAFITVDGTFKHLGYFKTPEAASLAYREAKKHFHNQEEK